MPDVLTQDLPAAGSAPAATDGFGFVRNTGGATWRDEFLQFQTLWTSPHFLEAIRDAVGTVLVAGSNVTITVNDAADSITISAAGGGGGGGGLDAEAVRDLIGSTLVAGSNVTITVDDPGDTITISAAGGGGGGSGSPDWTLPAAINNPAGNIAPTGLSGSTVQRVTGLAGNRTVTKPAGTFPAGKRSWVLMQVSAAGGPWVLTPGAGISHDGVGILPTLQVPADGTLLWLLYTDDAGTTFKFSGDYDFGVVTIPFEISNPDNGVVKIFFRTNTNYSQVISALLETDAGGITANFQICDLGTNFAMTNVTSITGMNAVAASTTPGEGIATGGNALQTSGTVDRGFQVSLSGKSGSPTLLRGELRLKRA